MIKTRILNERKQSSILVSFMLSFYIITLGVNSTVNLFAYGTPVDTAILYLIYACLIVIAVPSIIRNIQTNHLLFLFIVFMVCVISLTVNYSDDVRRKIVSFFFTVFPFYFVGATLNVDLLYIKKVAEKMVFLACIGALSYILFTAIPEGGYTHAMTTAYALLPMAIISIYYAFNRKNWWHKLVLLVIALEIFFFGVRGPIVLFIISFFIIAFQSIEKKISKGILIFICVLLFIIIISGAYINGITFLSDKMQQIGITNSVLKRILENSFMDDNGRNAINKEVFDIIKQYPLFGHGLFYDRVAIGGYTHNYITELIINFGIPVGATLSLVFIVRMTNLVRRYIEDKFGFTFVIMLVAMTIGYLMWSSSYLHSQIFFLTIGLFMNKGIITKIGSKENETVEL